MSIAIDCTVNLVPESIEVTLLPSSSIDVGLFGPNQIDVNYGHVGPQGPAGPPGASLTLKGSVPTAAELPTSGNAQGDLWIAADTGHGWVWDDITGWADGPDWSARGDRTARCRWASWGYRRDGTARCHWAARCHRCAGCDGFGWATWRYGSAGASGRSRHHWR